MVELPVVPAQCLFTAQRGEWLPVLLDPDLPPLPCRSGGLEIRHGGLCVVETADGLFLGSASAFTSPVLGNPRGAPGRVVRRATVDDQRRRGDLESPRREIMSYLRLRPRAPAGDAPPQGALPLAGRKAVVYFTAEQRVDFRPLLRELGRRYRRRVEMRPLGVRDGAKLTGGLGRAALPLLRNLHGRFTRSPCGWRNART
jgi:hypothetical protein